MKALLGTTDGDLGTIVVRPRNVDFGGRVQFQLLQASAGLPQDKAMVLLGDAQRQLALRVGKAKRMIIERRDGLKAPLSTFKSDGVKQASSKIDNLGGASSNKPWSGVARRSHDGP